MAGILEFDTSALRAMVRCAGEATSYRISMEELYDPGMHVNGVISTTQEGKPDIETIDPAELIPRLWLVKGDGVYLTPNAAITDASQPPRSYAVGLSPIEPGSDLRGRQIMGCRDCLISLPAKAFEEALKASKPSVRIRISAERIEILT